MHVLPLSKGAVAFFALSALVYQCTWVISNTYFPILLESLHATPTQVGLLLALGPAMIPLQLLSGFYSDRVQRRFNTRTPFLLTGALVAVIALAAMPFSPSLWIAGVAIAGAWVGVNIFQSSNTALLSERVPDTQRHKVTGSMALVRSVTIMLFYLLVPLLVAVGLQVPFLLAALLAAVGSLAAYFGFVRRTRPRLRTQTSPGPGYFHYLLRPPARAFFPAMMCCHFSLQLISSFFFLFTIHEVLGVERFTGMESAPAAQPAFYTLAIASITAVLVTPAVVRLISRFGPGVVLALGLSAPLGGMLLGWFVTSIEGAYLLSLFFGVGLSIVMVIPFSLLARLHPPGLGGTFSGIYYLSIAVGQIAASASIGFTIDYFDSYRVIFPVGAVMLGAAILLYGLFFKLDAVANESEAASAVTVGATG
ncbi:MFS transporter [Microbulbifer sp. Q7]|uniref:MFS transporter n=1 Tax=Microbulbifer sp. Q7 TaxID=1785091 RepID=UPI00082FD0E3|nr:MFS transporter [Microbulbifer sp. Q7]